MRQQDLMLQDRKAVHKEPLKVQETIVKTEEHFQDQVLRLLPRRELKPAEAEVQVRKTTILPEIITEESNKIIPYY